MIKVDAKEYCQTCKYFNPEADILCADGEATVTIVRCIYYDQCLRVHALSMIDALRRDNVHTEVSGDA